MSDSTITVERTINASTDAVFDVLSNPDRHVELDGSGFVTAVAKGDRIQGVGDTFRMNMTGDHMGGDYQTDNTVTGYDKNHLLSWQTAPAGKEPPGWEWVWELESQGSDQTLVRHTYDWSKVTDRALLDKGLFPLVSADQLEDTLQRLDQQVTGS
jgi:uncharacterized protein YndB with AHSA1/START domain